MSYKILCSDLDGTLLNNDTQISQENLQAIEELIQKGVLFVPSTGRTFSELPDELKNNPSIRYMIYANGAVVFDREKNQRKVTGVSNQAVNQILDVLGEYEAHVTMRYNDNVYADKVHVGEEEFDYYNVCEGHRVVLRAFAKYEENLLDFCRKADQVEVVVAFFRHYDELVACREKLEKIEGLRITGVSEYNLEIMNANAGKGNALYMLADMLGIDRTATISIGDSDNDASITQAAGLGLAVSNARASLKEVADKIICSNDEHAIAYVFSHYFE
jgi:Cof subfamily protein (haloacid dehalogenase superfamily)